MQEIAARQFLMPTRLVHGAGTLGRAGELARSLGMTDVLVVSDPAIARQSFHRTVLDALRTADVRTTSFDECAVDARLDQVDSQGAKCVAAGLDGIVCLGGGSVMCTGKGAAIVATNGGSLRDHAGPDGPARRPLPTLMVPTTAGSGVEVSQFTIVKDDKRHRKIVAGGPLCFPGAAILDPATLASLPPRLAAASAIDALAHALEAVFTTLATPLTDAIALEAARLLHGCLRASILDGDPAARADNLLGSAMANIACGNARLGLGHALSMPLEARLGLPHTVGVGVLLPRVIAFCVQAAPGKIATVATALGIDKSAGDPARAVEATLFALYDDLGLPNRFTPDQLPHARLRELAEAAIPGLYGGVIPARVDAGTVIDSPALRPMTVGEAEQCLLACL